MKKKSCKNILIGITTLSLITGASLGIAATSAQSDLINQNQPAMQLTQANKPRNIHNIPKARLMKYNKPQNIRIKQWRQQHSYQRQFQLGLHNKNISKQQATIITQAALIMQNYQDYTVGNVSILQKKNSAKLYKIQIMNSHNKLASVVILNSASGHIKPWKLHSKNK